MASEEKYLWVFTYRFHEDNRMWWTYFKDRREAEACVERLMGLFPCVEMLSLEEQVQGLRLIPFYYHYRCSDQRYADTLDKKMLAGVTASFFRWHRSRAIICLRL